VGVAASAVPPSPVLPSRLVLLGGELGFFKVERGTNALQIESGDCWAASVEHSVEDAVLNGTLEGSMYGLHRGKGRDAGSDRESGNQEALPVTRRRSKLIGEHSVEASR